MRIAKSRLGVGLEHREVEQSPIGSFDSELPKAYCL